MKVLKIFLIVLGFIVIVVFLLVYFLNSPVSGGLTVDFEVRGGESLLSISERLEGEGLVREERVVYYYAWFLLYMGHKIQKGKYRFSDTMSGMEIVDKIVYGDVVEEKIVLTIPEGYNVYDIAFLLVKHNLIKDKSEFLDLVYDKGLLERYGIDSVSMEGYLYPTTYFVSPNESVGSLVFRMIKVFRSSFPEEEYVLFKGSMSRREIITLASLIEKETSIDEERRIVSSVYHNRLKRNMRLECDPTVIYALIKAGKYRGNLSRRRGDLDIRSRYNTYLYRGLPPTPIANPGRESILAALRPSGDKYIFFVAKNDRSHLFSETWAGHLNNIKLYKRWLRKRRRAGKLGN